MADECSLQTNSPREELRSGEEEFESNPNSSPDRKSRRGDQWANRLASLGPPMHQNEFIIHIFHLHCGPMQLTAEAHGASLNLQWVKSELFGNSNLRGGSNSVAAKNTDEFDSK